MVYVTKCADCNREIEGLSQSQAEYLMQQHQLSKEHKKNVERGSQ